jgi:hypothetical protein
LSAPDVTVCFPNQLGDKVKIPNRLEELCKATKVEVYVDLFDMSLMQPGGIKLIIGIWAAKYLLARTLHDLPPEKRPLAVVLCKA